VSDFDRAKKFYENIFGYQMPENTMGPARMGFFLYDMHAGKVGGAIVCHPEFYAPCDNGSLIYLNCQPNLQIVLDKVEKAGGIILMAKKPVAPELGYWALIKDCEGNRVALHSMA
ncbi:MAG TPA: VOC family protein, partial [Panacibacter sp.]|nr:VOC family protein [Panacibacter sp.]